MDGVSNAGTAADRARGKVTTEKDAVVVEETRELSVEEYSLAESSDDVQ